MWEGQHTAPSPSNGSACVLLVDLTHCSHHCSPQEEGVHACVNCSPITVLHNVQWGCCNCMPYTVTLVVECVGMWYRFALCIHSCPDVCRSQAPPTSLPSTPNQSSLPPPVEVALPLHVSHVVLCEGIGTGALEQVISFLYTGSVDISEGSPCVRVWACAVQTDRPLCTVWRYCTVG